MIICESDCVEELMPIYHQFLGKRQGNFRLGVVDKNEIISLIEKSKTGDNFPVKLFIPRCDFTNRIISESDEFEKWNDSFLISKELADGIILKNPYHAGLLFNADCLMIGVYDLSTKRLAVVHGGFKCLKRDGYDKDILSVLFSRHGFNPKRVLVSLGWGIGSCCYGINDSQEEYLWNLYSGILHGRYVSKGPRENLPAVDLRRIALKILMDLGVAKSAIEIDETCTACSGRSHIHSVGDYHSHAWDGRDAGRNAAFMWYSDAGLK